MVRSLPTSPSLEFEKKQAKKLLKALRAGDVDARSRFAIVMDENGLDQARLSDAQWVLAFHDLLDQIGNNMTHCELYIA